MRFTAKQLANIAVVTVLGLAATLWAVFGLAHVSFTKPKTVRVQLASSGGALPGAEVTYLGVPVGRVSSAKLVADALELKLEVRPKGPMPRDLKATVRQKTALGEPYVDLAPARNGEPAGDPDGVVIPTSRTQVPRTLDQLLEQADQVLADVDPKDLTILVDAGSGLAGHEADLKAITEAGARIGDVLSRRRAELGDLLTSSAGLVQTMDANRDAIAGSLSAGARLTQVFASHADQLVKIMDTAGDIGEAGGDLLRSSRADMNGVLAGLDASTRPLATHPQKADEILTLVPPYLQGIAKTFSDGLAWSSDGGTLAGPYQPLYALPLDGKGLQIEDLFVPSLMGKIKGDFNGSNPGGALLLLTPEQFRRASSSPEAYEQVKAEALARLKEQAAKMAIGQSPPSPDAVTAPPRS